jgi:ribosomal protein S18 acetylase RimI-like enzyme
MIIRKMILEDISQLAGLYRQFWNEESNVHIMQKQFEKLKINDTHILLSAVDENQLIGSIMGIGKALIQEIESIARERKCTQIILVTESDREDACSFYERGTDSKMRINNVNQIM